tara:strand:- start:702 stop:1025 length:324 start_codon:yes stop_codon:yes gene_type:complete
MGKENITMLLNEIKNNSHKNVIVYTLDGCPSCEELKSKLDNIGIVYESIIMNGNTNMWDKLEEMGGSEYAPQVQVEEYLIKESEYDSVNDLISETITNLVGRKITVT